MTQSCLVLTYSVSSRIQIVSLSKLYMVVNVRVRMIDDNKSDDFSSQLQKYLAN